MQRQETLILIEMAQKFMILLQFLTILIFAFLIYASIAYRDDFEGHPKILIGLFFLATYGGSALLLINLYTQWKKNGRKKPNSH